MTSRLQPTAEERGVLCAMLSSVDAWRSATEQLTPRDFSSADHATLFQALAALTPSGKQTDVIGLRRRLNDAKRADLADYATELLGDVFAFSALPNWIAAVLEASAARRTAAVLESAAKAIRADTPRVTVETDLERQLTAIRAAMPDGRAFDDKAQMAAQAMAYLDDDARAGTPYGFAPWDAAVLPAMPSHLILLGGASGAGKSAVARNVERGWVQRYERKTGLLTCEMSGEEQLVHHACIDAQVAIEDYYRRRLASEERKRFIEALTWWRDTDLLKVNEMGSVTPERAIRIFRRWREQGVTHFVLDHLHRLDYGASKSGDDLRVPVAAFAKALKNFAKDCEATVFALVQYSKIKPHEEPSDDKIREANNVLEEADAVFHLYRPHVACERDTHGNLVPLRTPEGGRYFEGSAPHGTVLAPDRETVYLKLGKQRRRLRDGLIRIPFNHRLALLYDTARPELQRIA